MHWLTEQVDLINPKPQKASELTAILSPYLAEQVSPLWPALLKNANYIDNTLKGEAAVNDQFVYWPS